MGGSSDRSTAGLVPWKPGQSGNPKGGSRKRTLRQRLNEALNTKLPPRVADRILEELGREFPMEDYGDAAIAQLVHKAIAKGNLAALQLLVALEPEKAEALAQLQAAQLDGPYPDPFPDIPETVPNGETLQ